ncbi:MAG: hypothetical protein ACK44W_13350, partial [Planctomycetota bacterium]
AGGAVQVRLGRGRGRVWVELSAPPRARRFPDRELAACRPLLALEGAVLRRMGGHRVRVSFAPA